MNSDYVLNQTKMSNVILSYCYHDVKDNSSAELEKKYCRGVSSNVTNSKLTGIFVIILTMCVCIRSVESSAEIRGKCSKL